MKKFISIFLTGVIAMTMMNGCNTVQEKQQKYSPDKICALTFDDGPDAVKTVRVLDKLKEHDVTGSFFVIGKLITPATISVLERIKADGCEIHNHSWDYSSMSSFSADQIQDSISKTAAAVKAAVQVDTAFFRAPNLATSTVMFANVGLPFIQGIDSKDWQTTQTAQNRADNVLNSTQLRDGAIILMHDVQGGEHPTPEALDILIPELKRRGYEFVTVSELFSRKGIQPDPNAQKTWTVVE